MDPMTVASVHRLTDTVHQIDLLIDGRLVPARDGARSNVRSPATGEIVGSVAVAAHDDLNLAVASAQAAFKAWSKRTAYDREKLSRNATAHVRTKAESIGRLMALEQGKPWAQSTAEVMGGCDTIDYYAAEGVRVEGYSSPTEAENLRSWVCYHPVGVCGLISPWNYPVSLLSWKLGPALAAGCTAVVKPSPVTPMSSTAFCAALIEGGLPAGVVNVINSPSADLGDTLVRHPDIAMIAMTGSTTTGKKILAAAASQLKKVTLELGGQCPAIVCSDADLDLAAKIIAYKGFRNMGQACSAVNRVFVHCGVHDALAAKLMEHARKLTIGDGVTDPKVDLGPMATTEVLARVRDHVADAIARGASVITGGKPPDGKPYALGNYYLPTVLANVAPGSLVLRDETFGPVVPLVPFDDLAHAVARANDTPFGLAAFVFTRDMSTTIRISDALEVGTVCVNNGAVNTNYGPYAGWKKSGYGLELSRRAIYEYLKPKHLKVQL
jgi:succinate-semialdehyde dehydrogenase/glutarate-semialdehyde dehydrogenase